MLGTPCSTLSVSTFCWMRAWSVVSGTSHSGARSRKASSSSSFTKVNDLFNWSVFFAAVCFIFCLLLSCYQWIVIYKRVQRHARTHTLLMVACWTRIACNISNNISQRKMPWQRCCSALYYSTTEYTLALLQTSNPAAACKVPNVVYSHRGASFVNIRLLCVFFRQTVVIFNCPNEIHRQLPSVHVFSR